MPSDLSHPFSLLWRTYQLAYNREGLAAAFTWTTALAVLSDVVPHERNGQWLGYCLAAQNVGMVIAPILGGVLFERCGYYVVFAVVVILLMLDLILRLVITDKSAGTNLNSTTYWCS